MSAGSAQNSEVEQVTEQLDATNLDNEEHWEEFWGVAFKGIRGEAVGYYGLWHLHKDDTMVLTSKAHCIRSYIRSEDGKALSYHNLYEQKPATGRCRQRPDGLFEHQHVKQFSEPYFSCNMQLAPSEKADGKPACFYWRAVSVSNSAVSRFQTALPPMAQGSLPPIPNTDYANCIWAMEAYLQDGDNRWSIGPVYSLHNLHLLTHIFIQEHATSLDPSGPVSFAEQPLQEARGKLEGDPTLWMDGGTWEGTMIDVLWDEDGEMCRCSPRPAEWVPPAIPSGRKSMDSLLALKRLFLYPDMMYGYFPERLPATADAAQQRRGVRLEIGGMMRTKREFRRTILRYTATGEVASLTEEVYHPPS